MSRSIVPKWCGKTPTPHEEHHWYDGPRDQWSHCGGKDAEPFSLITLPPHTNPTVFPPGSEKCQ